MPRYARVNSESLIYHIILRGNNRQQIFFDKEDYEKFLQILNDCKCVSKFKIYAYCLMGNHIHLLIKETEESIDLIVKRITNRFVYWYNNKYSRSGHLFQGRFMSEPVEKEEYFFTVIRYIHQNPVKASICKETDEYIYSSFREYFSDMPIYSKTEHILSTRLCSVKAVFKMIDKDSFYAYNMQMDNEDVCLEIRNRPLKIDDEAAVRIIIETAGCSINDFQQMPLSKQRDYIVVFKEKGLSIRQICRLTGINFNIVRYC